MSVGVFVLLYQRGFWYIHGSLRRGIGYRLPVLPLHIPVWYTHGLSCDQVVHPVINGDKKGGEPHVLPLLYPMYPQYSSL